MDERHRGMGAGRRFRRALSLGSAALALASGLALAASTGAGAITPGLSPTWLQATSITMPTGALSTAPAQLLGVYCLHDGSFCLAAGSFQKSTTNGDLPMVVSEAGGTWGTAKQLTLPTGAATKARSDASDVWCATSTSCVAVGYYRYSANSGKYNKPFIATMGAGGWNKATGIPLPSNSTTPTNAKLIRISCSSHGNCGAVGTYRDKDGDIEIGGYIQEGGKWITSHWIVVPSDAPKSGKTVTPYGISCPATGDCVGVGKYNNAAGVVRPFIFTSTNGTWNPGFSINLPADAKSKAGDLHAVSCPSAGNCVAVGNYIDMNGHRAVFSVTETGGTWNKNAKEITTAAPADAATPPAPQLNGLSCVDTATCDAVGFYTKGGTPNLVSPLSVAYSTSTWQTGAGVLPPANSSTTSAAFSQFKDVSCWAQWGCAGVGNYINAGGIRRPMVALGNNGAG